MIVRRNLQEERTPLGNKLMKRLLCGELLCGKRYFAEVLMRTPLGIPVLLFEENSAGGS